MERLLGLLAHTMGIIEQATAHFEEALAFHRKANSRPELAWGSVATLASNWAMLRAPGVNFLGK